MTPATPADASPAAGEIVAWRIKDYADDWWVTALPEVANSNLNGALVRPLVDKALLDAFRAETDAMRAERDEANARGDRLARDLREMSYARGEMEKFMLYWWRRAQALYAAPVDEHDKVLEEAAQWHESQIQEESNETSIRHDNRLHRRCAAALRALKNQREG